MNVYYFGCFRREGHYLFPSGSRSFVDWKECPWGYSIDGGLLKDVSQNHQGLYVVDHKDGWTAVAFWDRSVDDRYGSNSAFLVHEDTTAEIILEEARKQWPEVFDRTDFPELIPQRA